MKLTPVPSLRACAPAAERGVTLIVVLLILVVVTVLGIGGAQIALLGERSTRYDRDYLVATQAAEAALMDAEFDIRGPNSAASDVQRVDQFTQANLGVFIPGCGTSGKVRGLCEANPDTVKPLWATVDFLDDSANAPSVEFGEFTGRSFDAGTSGVRPERAPRYIIELIEDATPGGRASGPTPKMYRITAIGFGPRTDIQVVMQIAFRKEKG
jgi:type IV pilus assembly protein PilX